AFDFVMERKQGLLNHLLQRHVLGGQVSSIQASELEQIEDEPVHASGGSLDAAKIFLAGVVEHAAGSIRQLAAEAAQGPERCAKIMGDAVAEAVQRLDRFAQLGGAFLDSVF